jgi:flagellar motor switch protein FliM
VNLVRIQPLRGTTLIVFRTKLVFAVVDFFGAMGGFAPRSKTAIYSEMRVVQLLLNAAFVG